MKRVTMLLTVRVTYEKNDGSDLTRDEIDQVERNLDFLPQWAADNGALTEDAFEVVVEDMTTEVTVLKDIA